MKKTVALLSLSTFVFVGCNAGAHAQDMQATVGNPNSQNEMIIEQGYIVSGPAVVAPEQPETNTNQNTASPTPSAENTIESESISETIVQPVD